METIPFYKKESETDDWLEELDQHITDPNSKISFQIPEKLTVGVGQREFLNFIASGLPTYDDEENIIVCDLGIRKTLKTLEFQVGRGTAQVGLYFPSAGLELKIGTKGNRSVELSAKDLSRVREDKIIE